MREERLMARTKFAAAWSEDSDTSVDASSKTVEMGEGGYEARSMRLVMLGRASCPGGGTDT
jgi:hypothetical protein